MENPRIETKLRKRTIMDAANDARLLIAERELNEFSDNAESILITGKGNNCIREIISQIKIRFDEIDLTKVHKLLYCIIYNPVSANELHICDVYEICQCFDYFKELTPTVGLYQSETRIDDVELIIFLE